MYVSVSLSDDRFNFHHHFHGSEDSEVNVKLLESIPSTGSV